MINCRSAGRSPKRSWACRRSCWRPTRLFSLFPGTPWTLLGYDIDANRAPAGRRGLHIHTLGARGDILDTGGHVQSAYALAGPPWILVRPDGYLAAVADAADLGSIEAFLDTVGIRPAR
ncbi:hypothetical protein ACEZDB_17625 [Streptacidiphilus sp. N1-3]|uniref:Uncharacterized protein n=1 Tax=Streptacidiphilus alkalitolerans TaxID=3342712 RepID=A0ABV6X2F7_9ACTN